ncbi:Na+/melibiose symporter-like transporter [Coriobacterium glomerans PW2]|uniref:Na+/melibiose symporter-like transporter n=1 Tax=Coriobacterium glomerans (strain ATCC 49209 / DSM 20642 / JCM 10262 / PW2) TaxID=700015 RepID=F2NAN0_CORGP|nr:MFS transporter [Coriobacterium glomerans]AEB07486.1 Na+/melibiose symporter-like transporter [Coriobacterium glomerans PW2]
MTERRLATNRIIWTFATGQLGWSILSGVVTNWLVYFFQPGHDLLNEGQRIFITQGSVLLGMTTIGLITALGRFTDAFVDPWVASRSDACGHRLGRRVPFMRYAAIPFGAATILAFVSPIDGVSVVNDIFLLVTVLAFYVCMTCYCTPFNALIPELGRTQELRIEVSTRISFTYFIGTAIAYLVPNIAGLLQPALDMTTSFRVTIAALSVIAVACMLVPTFTIDEHIYAETTPSTIKMGESLKMTFSNRRFQVFVASDILYWIAITMFQTGLPFYITALMGLPDSMTFVLFALMTIMSLVFYAPVNALAKRMGKKWLVCFAFMFFCIAFGVTSLAGLLGIPGIAWGVMIAVLAAPPMAVLGILPQAVVADIAQADAISNGEARQGMFYAARTFSMKLGQSVAMILFTSVALIGGAGTGYRLSALAAMVLCLISGLTFLRYDEHGVLAAIRRDAASSADRTASCGSASLEGKVD